MIYNGGNPSVTIRTRDGGFAIGTEGWSGSPSRFDADFQLIKTDSLGILQWRRFFAPDTLGIEDFGRGLIELSNGGFIETGYRVGNPIEPMAVRTDSEGNLVWLRLFDELAQEFMVFDGSAPAVGDNFIAVSQSSAAMMNSDGDVLWHHNYGYQQGGEDIANVIATSDGGFLLIGGTFSIGAGSQDMFAVKIDSAGDLEWRNAYGTEDGECCVDAIQSWDGGYLLTGFQSVGEGRYSFAVRTDSEGDEIWRRRYNIAVGAFVSVVETPDSGFAVGGGGGYDFDLVRLNSDGDVLWQGSYLERGGQLNTVLLLDDYSYVMGGFMSGEGSALVRTTRDPLAPNAVTLLDPTFPSLFALDAPYPNPFNSSVSIDFELPTPDHVTVKVFDLIHGEVATLLQGEQRAGYHSVLWNGKNNAGISVTSGMYFVRLETPKVTKVSKMTLVK